MCLTRSTSGKQKMWQIPFLRLSECGKAIESWPLQAHSHLSRLACQGLRNPRHLYLVLRSRHRPQLISCDHQLLKTALLPYITFPFVFMSDMDSSSETPLPAPPGLSGGQRSSLPTRATPKCKTIECSRAPCSESEGTGDFIPFGLILIFSFLSILPTQLLTFVHYMYCSSPSSQRSGRPPSFLGRSRTAVQGPKSLARRALYIILLVQLPGGPCEIVLPRGVSL